MTWRSRARRRATSAGRRQPQAREFDQRDAQQLADAFEAFLREHPTPPELHPDVFDQWLRRDLHRRSA